MTDAIEGFVCLGPPLPRQEDSSCRRNPRGDSFVEARCLLSCFVLEAPIYPLGLACPKNAINGRV